MQWKNICDVHNGWTDADDLDRSRVQSLRARERRLIARTATALTSGLTFLNYARPSARIRDMIICEVYSEMT